VTEAGGTIELRGLSKSFGDEAAVVDLNLEIKAGEFFSLIGPSGCGKTTTLRMIAGFEEPSAGEILLDGVDVAAIPAHKRPVNTVFQSYALFPHLSVEDNVAYGLRWQRSVDRAERHRRVGEALELVQLSSYAKRRPHQLSGGQQQRVALARALVLQPSVLLLDEPLGALDAKLRKTLRQELTTLHHEVGVTFVFVTHDQEEALEMSDRLAVMDRGRVVQSGAPRDVYAAPLTAYVADFLGVANLLDVECLGARADGLRTVRLGDAELVATPVNGDSSDGGHVVIRPERVRLATGEERRANSLPGTVDQLVYVGATTQVQVRLPHGQSLQALVVNDGDRDELARGARVTVTLPPAALRLLAAEPAA
jgi:spermidine/putrescine transport system ATP-binding protein